MAFIISKRNFLVRREDGSEYMIRKDYVGPIKDEDMKYPVVQMAIRGGMIAVSDQTADKALDEAKEKSDAAEVDIRPDAGAVKNEDAAENVKVAKKTKKQE